MMYEETGPPYEHGTHGGRSGEMTILTGEPDEVLERCRSVLEIMGGEIVHMGEVGSASLIKVITNMLCLIDLVAMGEVLAHAKACGLNLAKVYDAVRASSGNSREFEDWAP